VPLIRRSAIASFVLAAVVGVPVALGQSSSTADLPDAPGAAAKPAPVPSDPTLVIDTSMGRITCKTFPQVAPNAVDNFVGLAEGSKDWTDDATHTKQHGKRFYDGLTFHRVIPGFMIQGGDPSGNGTGDAGYYLKDEIDSALTFSVPGRLAMANSGPDTNGSQFFITEQPVDELDGKYTIFGQCDQPSVDVVKAIAAVPRNAADKPLTPVVIEHITVVREGQPMPPAPAVTAMPAAPVSPGTAASPGTSAQPQPPTSSN
jgi:peptidyl-prolyl cis-trans isomerase A (cyclophilin A)